MFPYISVYTSLSISYYTSQWKSLGKSLGDCDVAVKVPEKVPETFSGTSSFRSPQYILRYTELYWDILISAEYISVYTTGPPHQAFYFVTVSVLWHNSVYLEYIFLAQFPCYATTAVILIMVQLYSVILSSPGGQLSKGNEVNWAMLCVSSRCTPHDRVFTCFSSVSLESWPPAHLSITGAMLQLSHSITLDNFSWKTIRLYHTYIEIYFNIPSWDEYISIN